MNKKSFPIQNLQEGGEIDPSVDPRRGSHFPLSQQGKIWQQALKQMGQTAAGLAKMKKKPTDPVLQNQQGMQEGGQVEDDEQQTVPPMTPEEFDRLYRIMLERDEINRRKAMNEPQGMQGGGFIGGTPMAGQGGTPGIGGNKIGPPMAGGGVTPITGGFQPIGPPRAGQGGTPGQYPPSGYGGGYFSDGHYYANNPAAIIAAAGRMSPIRKTFPIGRMPPGQVPPGKKPKPTGFKQGGETDTDTVPIMATPGEFVLNRGAVETAGRPFLHALNEMGKGHPAMMQEGGDVPSWTEPPDIVNPAPGVSDIGSNIFGPGAILFGGDASTGGMPTIEASGGGGGLRDLTYGIDSSGGFGGSNWGLGSGLTSSSGLSMGGIGGFSGSLFGQGSSGGGIPGVGWRRSLLQEGGPVPNRPQTFPVQMQGQGMNPQALGQMINSIIGRRMGFEGAKNRHFALRARHQFNPQQMAQPQRRRRQQFTGV